MPRKPPPELTLPAALLTLLDLPITAMPGAACRGHAPLFDETLHGETEAEQTERHERARAMCSRCPALEQCATAVATIPRSCGGVWAGVLLSDHRYAAAGG